MSARRRISLARSARAAASADVSPWVASAPRDGRPAESEAVDVVPAQRAVELWRPQPGSVDVDGGENPPFTPRLAARRPDVLWLLGAHGGAGERTLEVLLDGDARAAGRSWPVLEPAGRTARVVVVGRTSAHGLRSAQRVIREWASGAAAAELVGLVLIADAPGRLPRPLHELAALVAGGAPAAWRLPWVEAWRLGEPPSAAIAPRAVTAVLRELHAVARRPAVLHPSS